MAISNFADWFVPTATAATEAAAEPETADQAPPDFAALLAASYLAPPAVAAPIIVPPSAAEPIVQTLEARPVAVAFTLPTELRATVPTPLPTVTAPLMADTTPIAQTTPVVELTSEDGQTDVRPLEAASQREAISNEAAHQIRFNSLAVASRSEPIRRRNFHPVATSSQSEPALDNAVQSGPAEPNNQTTFSPSAATKEDHRLPPVPTSTNVRANELVAAATTEKIVNLPGKSSAMERAQPIVNTAPLTSTTNDATPPATANPVPANPLRAIAPSLNAPAPGIEMVTADQPVLPPVTRPQKDVAAFAPPETSSSELPVQSRAQDDVPPTFTVAAELKIEDQQPTTAPPTAPDLAVETATKIERENAMPTPPIASRNPPEPLPTGPKAEIVATNSAQPIRATWSRLPSTSPLPIVTEMVKLAAAVVKTIAAEQARHTELSTPVSTKDLPAPDIAAISAPVASIPVVSEQVQIQKPELRNQVESIAGNSEPLTFVAPTKNFTIAAPLSVAPQPLSAPLSAAPPKAVHQTPKPIIVEAVESATTRAPLVSDSAEPLPPAFDNAPRVVADQTAVAWPSPTLPLEFREGFTMETLTETITAPNLAASPSASPSMTAPPAVNIVPGAPAPLISQAFQPVLELAQSVHPHETRTLRFSLNPAELGRVDVEVTRNADGHISASLTVEQADTAQALTQGIGQLRESLERAGLIVEQLQIATQLQPQTAQQFGQQTGQQADQPPTSNPYDPNADSSLTDPTVGDGPIPGSENKLLSLHA